MKTNEIVIHKVKDWLKKEGKSYQWLAEQLAVGKALVGQLLSGERTLQPRHIKQLSVVMGISVKELLAQEQQQSHLTVQIRRNMSNRFSKRKLDALLFVIEDYVSLKEQVKE